MRIVALLLLLPLSAAADIITEWGAGVKLERHTSYVMLPACHEVIVVVPAFPENPRGLTDRYSCGGDNPAFIGWPIAWQSDFSDVWTIRAGWFHYSNWMDGGRDRETHMDAIATTVTFNWSKWRDGRRK